VGGSDVGKESGAGGNEKNSSLREEVFGRRILIRLSLDAVAFASGTTIANPWRSATFNHCISKGFSESLLGQAQRDLDACTLVSARIIQRMSEPPPLSHSVAPPRPARNPWAGISLALGIISVLMCGNMESLEEFYFLLASVPAIICGYLAERRIARSTQPMRGFRMAGVGLWLGILTGIFLPLLMVLGGFREKFLFNKKSDMSIAINHCRQVIIALRLYSADHDGKYPDAALPDAKHSNEVFRRLFVEGVCTDESIFGSPRSDVGKPDGNIGKPPDFLEALRPGENHWAIAAGLNDSSDSSYPLVFECPSDASWPPKWNAVPGRPSGNIKPGGSWAGGKVIVGMNDGSVTTQSLVSKEGQNLNLGPQSRTDTTSLNVFTQNGESHKILPPAQK